MFETLLNVVAVLERIHSRGSFSPSKIVAHRANTSHESSCVVDVGLLRARGAIKARFHEKHDHRVCIKAATFSAKSFAAQPPGYLDVLWLSTNRMRFYTPFDEKKAGGLRVDLELFIAITSTPPTYQFSRGSGCSFSNDSYSLSGFNPPDNRATAVYRSSAHRALSVRRNRRKSSGSLAVIPFSKHFQLGIPRALFCLPAPLGASHPAYRIRYS